jgi:hypothetical protein
MLKRVSIILGGSCCMLTTGGVVSAAWADMQGDFPGQYIIYGGYPDKESARAPSPGDTKVAFSIRGPAAKDLFDAIGPAPRPSLSRGEERCEKNPKVRIRDLSTISCRYHPKDGYLCTFGFDLSTGLSTWGKVGDTWCP